MVLGFDWLRNSAFGFIGLFALLSTIYYYYAILVEPCKTEISQCPGLEKLAGTIFFFQILDMLTVLVTVILFFISMKRIYETISLFH